LTLIANDADAQDAALFRPPQAPGYGVREALSEREDICYAALMTSVKAASHMLRQAAGATDDMVHVVCPLVIISAPLLLCSLDEDEELELMDVEEADVHWRYPSPSGAPYTIVKIMRLSRLGDYAHECAADLRRLLRKFPDRSELESAAAIIKRSAAWTPII
jgi:hypothetical protein